MRLKKTARKVQIPRVAILVDTSTSWGRRVLQGINNYARNHGPWQVFVEARGGAERLRVPAGWQGDGIIARVSDSSMVAALRALNLPVVNVSAIELPDATFPRVTYDIKAGAAMALNHFLDRGFRHFAYFDMLGMSYVTAQQNAFMEAARQSGHECEVYSIKPRTETDPDWNLDLVKVGRWLKSLPKPVGLLTWSPGSGRELINACQIAGLLVPEEVAIISGSNEDILCEMLRIPLSAIQVGSEQIGHHAAGMLDKLMRHGTAPKKPIYLPPLRIVTRQSTDTLALKDPALVKALSFIRHNAGTPIQVGDVAREAGLSRRVLERRLLQSLGRSPATEIRRVHLERAKSLLVGTDLPIPDVADAAGFGSPEYFACTFKAEMRKTPLQYRKEIRSR